MANLEDNAAQRFDDEGMRLRIEALVLQAIDAAVRAGDLPDLGDVDLGVSRTTEADKGDWTSTVAMRSAKVAHRAPRDVANAIAAHLPADEAVASTEVAGPGFLNFRLSRAALTGVFSQIRAQGTSFGSSDDGAGRSVDVEFVSANPVGPMHVGHGRWAALGDSLCRVLTHCGWKVTREFYINDAGSQMDVFGRSIDKRYRQLCALVAEGDSASQAYDRLEADRVAALEDADGARPQDHPLTDDFSSELGESSYGGAYIIDVARDFFETDGPSLLDMPDDERHVHFREAGYQMMLSDIKATLADCGTTFDVWYSERTLHAADKDGSTAITRAFDLLRSRGLLFEDQGATWFRSTAFGDDKDRVLVKSDGSYTYFAADVAYHADKLARGFDRLIDIWGADHHGYIPRMKAAVSALGHEGQLDVLLGQLVNLLRDGVPVRMSKRRGTMITFREVLDTVGSDAARFTLVSRSSEQEIDFDIEKVKRQSSDNPVFYVQYAHARICSILARAAGIDATGMTNRQLDAVAEALVGENPDLNLLEHSSELALARHLASFGTCVRGCAADMAPHRLAYYATDLAAAFHGFYTNCHVLSDDEDLTRARLVVCDASRRVLELALSLIGVSAPVHMDSIADDGDSDQADEK